MIQSTANWKLITGSFNKVTNHNYLREALSLISLQTSNYTLRIKIRKVNFIYQNYLSTTTKAKNQSVLYSNSEYVNENENENGSQINNNKDLKRKKNLKSASKMKKMIPLPELLTKMKDCNRHGKFLMTYNYFKECILASKHINNIKDRPKALNIELFNVTLTCLIRINSFKEFWMVYEMMNRMDINPDVITFNLLLKACIEQRNWSKFERIIKKMDEYHLKANSVTYFLLFKFYIVQNKDVEAIKVLNLIENNQHLNIPSILTYHKIIEYLCKVRKMKFVLKVYKVIKNKGFPISDELAISMLRGFFINNQPHTAHQLFSKWISEGNEFNNIIELEICMIEGMILNQQYIHAFNYLKTLKKDVNVLKIWDRLLYPTFNKGQVSNIEIINQIKRFMVQNFKLPKSCLSIDLDLLVRKYLIEPYHQSDSYLGYSTIPRDNIIVYFFDVILKEVCIHPSIKVFNILAQILCNHDLLNLAIQLLEIAEDKTGSIPPSLYNILLKEAFKKDERVILERLLNQLQNNKVQVNSLIFSTIINGYCKSNEPNKALVLYISMRQQGYPILFYNAIKLLKLSHRLNELNFRVWLVKDTLGINNNINNLNLYESSLSQIEIESFINHVKSLKSPGLEYLLEQYYKVKQKLKCNNIK